MKKILYFIFGTALSCLSSMALAANTPVGLWKTIDDVTNKPKSIIKITESPSHDLSGTVVKIFPRPGHDQNELCEACKGSKHNQRIVGMTILTGLRQDAGSQTNWVNGKILDPNNGKTYHCNAQVIDNGNKLSIRGYIGIPLFGRSQTWLRVNSIDD